MGYKDAPDAFFPFLAALPPSMSLKRLGRHRRRAQPAFGKCTRDLQNRVHKAVADRFKALCEHDLHSMNSVGWAKKAWHCSGSSVEHFMAWPEASEDDVLGNNNEVLEDCS